MDFRIELVPLPVTDVDRAVAFYGDTVGWNVDFDQTVHEGLRFVQVTPPGSACSICFGTGLDMLEPGSTQMIQVVVEDADAALGLPEGPRRRGRRRRRAALGPVRALRGPGRQPLGAPADRPPDLTPRLVRTSGGHSHLRF